jgi:hypothetical protein
MRYALVCSLGLTDWQVTMMQYGLPQGQCRWQLHSIVTYSGKWCDDFLCDFESILQSDIGYRSIIIISLFCPKMLPACVAPIYG